MLSRRSFLAGGMGLSAVRAALAQTERRHFQTSPFTLGVASGDPAADGAVRDGEDMPGTMGPVLSRNEFVMFFNSQRGYVSCELTPSLMRAELRVLDYVSRPGAPRRTRAVFVVEDGRCGAQRA